MTAKILSIVKKPNEAIIKFLGELLEEAKRGEILDICGVRGWSSNRVHSFSFGLSQMECVGMFQQGAHDMLNHWEDAKIPPDDIA